MHKTRKRVLTYIILHLVETGQFPKLREIAAGCELSTPSVASYHLKELHKDGFINKLDSEGYTEWELIGAKRFIEWDFPDWANELMRESHKSYYE